MKMLDPIHPGEILHEEFMRPLGITSERLGSALGVPVAVIQEIERGHRPITEPIAAGLAGYFQVNMALWLNLQAEYNARRNATP